MARASKTQTVQASEGTPFARSAVSVYPKEDGGKGIASMQSKPIEAGYVEPMQRNNPEYLNKLADQKLLSDIETKAKRDNALKAFGGGVVKIIGASPNSPVRTHKILF